MSVDAESAKTSASDILRRPIKDYQVIRLISNRVYKSWCFIFAMSLVMINGNQSDFNDDFDKRTYCCRSALFEYI